MKNTVAKMNGLNVDIYSQFTALYNQSLTNVARTLTVGPTQTTGSVAVWTIFSPSTLSSFITSQTTTADQKMYLRQCKMDAYMHNEESSGTWIRMTYFKVRRNIDLSTYGTWFALLELILLELTIGVFQLQPLKQRRGI